MSANPYLERVIESRDGKLHGIITRANQRCRLEGCTGVYLSTKWENGKRTFPCSKGVIEKPNGMLKIG
jgi:hypothetical protein